MTDLSELIEGTSWANIAQTATLMPLALAKNVVARGLPYWTRGYDRVSLLKPLGSGETLQTRRKFLQDLGSVWSGWEVGSLPFNATKAFSLQPKGYPLFLDIAYSKTKSSVHVSNSKSRTFRIITTRVPQFEFHRPVIDSFMNALNAKIDWVIVGNFQETLAAIDADPSIDFDLFSFGVADPEPATWMALVLSADSSFVSVDTSDLDEYRQIARLHNREMEVAGFRKLIEKVGLRGSYLPLFHYSTLSVARPGISFERVSELDETVDYSKLIVK